MSVRFAPFDAEPLGQANCVIVPDDAPACACGANGAMWVSRDRGNSWVAAQTSGTVSDLYACTFVDALSGWAVGEHGAIVCTTDGGARWARQASPTTEDLHSVAFSDSNHGVIRGARGTTFGTVDGGDSWVLDAAAVRPSA